MNSLISFADLTMELSGAYYPMFQNALVNEIPLITIIVCLAATIIIEVLIARIILKVRGQNLRIVALAQVVTNPLVNLILALTCEIIMLKIETNKIFPVGYNMDSVYIPLSNLTLFVLEVLAIIIEWRLYKKFFTNYHGRVKPFLLSLILNIASYSIGYILFEFF